MVLFIRPDIVFLDSVLLKVQNYVALMDWAKLKDGIKAVMDISSDYNKYIQDNEIWSSTADPERRRVVLTVLVNGIRLIAGL